MSDESLFREVDEEVRQDQYKKIWKQYGNYFTAMAVAVVLLVAGFKGWQYWQLSQSEKASRIFADAVTKLEEGKMADAEAAFAAIDHGGYAKLGNLRRAAALAGQGKTDEAVALYDSLANDQNNQQSIRDLARLRAGYVLADKLAPAELISRLGAFDNEQSPWRGLSREIFALAAYRTGDYTMADRYLNAIIADQGVALDVRQRAQTLLEVITPLLSSKK
ncbi:MAG: tetratricopeptide repeat protein [Parvibaculaceae bacterium]